MKTYKDFGKQHIGSSDIARLTLTGYQKGEGSVTVPLYFGQAGSYNAYIVEGEAEIGDDYEKKAEFHSHLTIFDDAGPVKRITGERIVVYRTAETGCIIQMFGQ